MPTKPINEIVAVFLDIWKTKEAPAGLPIDMSELSIEQAYAVQRAVTEQRIALGEKAVGYKVGCTSKGVRQQFGLTQSISGRLMAPHVYCGNMELHWSDFVNCAIEPEFVFCIGKDLGDGRATDEQLLSAIEWVAPGVEVHHFTFWAGAPISQELIASNRIESNPRNVDRWGAESLAHFV